MPDESPLLGRPLFGVDLYHMPEFKALCDAIGFAWEKATLGFTIDAPGPDELVTITQKYRATEPPYAEENVETTNLHNRVVRTFTTRPKLERTDGNPNSGGAEHNQSPPKDEERG